MYNRYIGNTGKFYRVEDAEPLRREVPQWEPVSPPESSLSSPPPPPPKSYPPLPPPEPYHPPPSPPPPPPVSAPAPLLREEASKFDLGAVFNVPGSLRETLRDKLPESLDLGDILLVLVLIYLFLEGDDDDMLIILGVLLFTWIWPLFKKEEV